MNINTYIYCTKGLEICRVSVLFIVFCCIKFPSSHCGRRSMGKCILGVLGTLRTTYAHSPPNKDIENTQNSQRHTFSKSNTSKACVLVKNTYSQITPNSWKLSIPFQCWGSHPVTHLCSASDLPLSSIPRPLILDPNTFMVDWSFLLIE